MRPGQPPRTRDAPAFTGIPSLDRVEREQPRCNREPGADHHDAGVVIDLLVGGRRTIAVRIEQTFQLIGPEGAARTVTVPVAFADAVVVAALARLWQTEAVRIYAADNGDLDVDFADSSRVHCGPDPDYEAWTLNGPKGLTLVAIPGGELAIWRPDEV